jgi:excisionase family DNA binding protein
MSPFSNPKRKWLKNDEAAEALGVTSRTIERWMVKTKIRGALGGVRHGKQWRIPRPHRIDEWRLETRQRLARQGIRSGTALRRAFGEEVKDENSWYLESLRLWLAGTVTALGRGRVPPEAKEALWILRNAASDVLRSIRHREMRVDRLKSHIAAVVLKRCADQAEALQVMRYWPDQRSFEKVRALRTPDDLEEVRQRLDYAQTLQELEHRGEKKPTNDKAKSMLHKDITIHVNDVPEELPGIIVKQPTAKQMREITMGSVYAQISGQKQPLVTFDFRMPQAGIAARTVKKRYPKKDQRQRDMIAGVYGTRADLAGPDGEPYAGEEPARGSDDDDPL